MPFGLVSVVGERGAEEVAVDELPLTVLELELLFEEPPHAATASASAQTSAISPSRIAPP
jgi:hypothetical protein